MSPAANVHICIFLNRILEGDIEKRMEVDLSYLNYSEKIVSQLILSSNYNYSWYIVYTSSYRNFILLYRLCYSNHENMQVQKN